MNRAAGAQVLTVGEVAARSGVAVSAVHFYERKGLIEGWRSGGNQRRYGRSVLRRIAIIKVAQQLGIPLAEIAHRFAALPPGRNAGRADWTRIAEGWRADLDRRIAQLTRLRDSLEGCIGCGCLSMESCPLRNPGDEAGAHGPGARYLDPGQGAQPA